MVSRNNIITYRCSRVEPGATRALAARSGGRVPATWRPPIAVCGHAASRAGRLLQEPASTQWLPAVFRGQPAKGRVADPVAAWTQTLSRQLNPTVATFQVNFPLSWAEPVFSPRGIFEVIAFTRFDFSTERDRAFWPPSRWPGETLSRVTPQAALAKSKSVV